MARIYHLLYEVMVRFSFNMLCGLEAETARYRRQALFLGATEHDLDGDQCAKDDFEYKVYKEMQALNAVR